MSARIPIIVRRPSACAGLAMALGVLMTAPVQAQSAGDPAGPAESKDPSVIITRTVQPRIAYRGIPVEDNPIHAEATTFPAGVFHDALGNMMGQLVGDEALGQHGSVGLAGQGVAQGLATDPRLLGSAGVFGAGAAGSGRIPAGQGASVGGAITGATAGIGDTINSAMQVIAPAMSATSTSTQGGGP